MSDSNVYYTPDNVPHDLRDFENIPAELRALSQWVCWKLETVHGRLTKIPYTAEGRKSDSTDPATWGTFELCRTALRSQKFFGIGFVFAADGNLTGIDFDKHRNPDTGELDPFAAAHVAQLNSYTEASQSGTGCHVIARATIPGDKGRRDAKTGVEMYSKARFFVMTGAHLDNTPRTVEPRQQAVEEMFREIFPDKKKPAPATTPTQPLALTDNDLINKASQSKQGAQFSALWSGDFAAAGYRSHSEADGALLGMLRFWTGGDKARSFSLFAQSGLNREKWEREDYRESTWALVCGGEIYSPSQPLAVKRYTNGAAEYLPSADEAGDTTTPNEAPQPPPVKRLSELARRTANDPNELLRDGYLCRGGGALWVAQTGIGKSVAELQAAIRWATGKPFFGIIPTRPLKSLIIQAENDDGDLAEFRDGIIAGLRLTPDEIKLVHENVLVVREDSRTGLPLCRYTVEPLRLCHWLESLQIM